MAIRIEGGLAIASFKRAFVGFKDPDAKLGTRNILRIPGVSDVSVDAPEAPTTAVDAVEGSTTEVGVAPIGNVTFTNSSLMMHTAILQKLHNAKTNGTVTNFIMQTKEQTVKAMTVATGTGAETAAIAPNTGVVTLSNPDSDFFDQDDLAIGECIVIDGKYYEIIEGMEDETTGALDPGSIRVVDSATGEYPVGAVTAKAFKVVIPGARFTGNAVVTQIGAWSAGVAAGNPMAGSIVITPRSRWAETGKIDTNPGDVYQ